MYEDHPVRSFFRNLAESAEFDHAVFILILFSTVLSLTFLIAI